jgi:hypothetical protein
MQAQRRITEAARHQRTNIEAPREPSTDNEPTAHTPRPHPPVEEPEEHPDEHAPETEPDRDPDTDSDEPRRPPRPGKSRR